MDDFQIRKVLPDLSKEKYDALLGVLNAIGAKKDVNLHLLTEKDFAGVLPLLEIRQLLEAWTSISDASPVAGRPAYSEVNSDGHTKSNSGCLEAGWEYRFKIPWESFPEPLLRCCREGTAPLYRDRLQMIRILASTIMKVQARPTRKSVEPIAHSIVSRYPNSFMDIADGIPMGSGHTSITNQIMARIDNYHKSERSRKRSVEALQVGAASTSTASSATGSEYGCVSWSPPLDPCMTDKYEKSRLVLLEESGKVIRNHEEISRLMELTYPRQGKNLNSNVPIESLNSIESNDSKLH